MMKTKGAAQVVEVGDLMAHALGNDRFEWQTMRIFLCVCMHGGEMPMQEIEKVTGWAQSSVSRNVAKLGNGVSMAEKGARLVEAYEDPEYRRRKLVRLTALGKQLYSQMIGKLSH